MAVVPKPFRRGVDPQMAGPLLAQTVQPYLAGLGVPMFIGTAGVEDFIRAHACIAHENAFPIRAIGAQHVPCGGLRVLAAAVVAPQAFIDAIVEIEMFEMAKFGPGGAEQFLNHFDIRVH